MAPNDTITTGEEVQRYYRRVKEATRPITSKIHAKDERSETAAEQTTTAELFGDDVDEEGWVDVNGSEQMPTDDNQENYRIATGTGPIEAASGVFIRKVSELSSAATITASQAPAALKACAENQTVRLAEAVGRVTVSGAVASVVQRYPLLERWRLAFIRGREHGSPTIEATSPPDEPPPELSDSRPEVDQMAELPQLCVGGDDMEDVPLDDDEFGDEEDETGEW